MEQLSLTTPGILFSAISLLLLAYTNRFLAIAALIRKLHADQDLSKPSIIAQINNLRRRVSLIKAMQFIGVGSLFFCVLCMFSLFFSKVLLGKFFFGIGLLLLLVSLGISIYEINISVNALNTQLKDLEVKDKNQ